MGLTIKVRLDKHSEHKNRFLLSVIVSHNNSTTEASLDFRTTDNTIVFSDDDTIGVHEAWQRDKIDTILLMVGTNKQEFVDLYLQTFKAHEELIYVEVTYGFSPCPIITKISTNLTNNEK